MRVYIWLATGLMTLTLSAGCGSSPQETAKPDNAEQICAEVTDILTKTQTAAKDSEYHKKLMEWYTTGDPAARAAADQAYTAENQRMAAKLEPLAVQATSADLKAALHAIVEDLLLEGTKMPQLSVALSKACRLPSGTPSR